MYQPDLMTVWESSSKHITFMWYFSLAYAIKEGSLSFNLDLKPYRKEFNRKVPKEVKISSVTNHAEGSIVKAKKEKLERQIEPSRNVDAGIWEGTIGGPVKRT